MRDTIEIDIRDLYSALLGKVRIIILVMILSAAAAYTATRYFIPPKYTSYVSMYVNNTQNRQASATLNLSDINAAQKFVNTYIVILQDDEVLDRVAARLAQEYSQKRLEAILPLSDAQGGKVLLPETLRGALRMSAVNNTEVLRIEAETASPELSARICTLMAEIAPAVLQRIVKTGSVEIIGEAKPAGKPSSPNIWLNCAVGFLAGGAVSVLWILIRHMTDVSIKDEQDLKKHFDLPVLGEIPDFGAAD